MRVFRAQIPRIATDIIQTLRKDQDIEVEEANVPEAIQDVVAVMDLYQKTDYEILEEAKDRVDRMGLTHSDLGRIKREICELRAHPVGESGIRWVCGQVVEGFMISRFIDEVYSDDQMLRRKIFEVFKRHIIDDALLDREVRERIKNLQEGTAGWNIQYQKVMKEVRRKHGLS